MTWIISAQERLREANGLAAVLDAAYDAFEGMLPVIRVGQDDARSLFALSSDRGPWPRPRWP